MANFCENLINIRKSHHLTQKQVADATHITQRVYQSYEYGTVMPTLPSLVALADYFGVSIDYLAGRTDNPEINK